MANAIRTARQPPGSRSPSSVALAVAGWLPRAGVEPARASTAFVVTKTADTNDGACSRRDCSLREAVVAANATLGSDTIRVPPGRYVLTRGGAGEDLAAAGDLDVVEPLQIVGAGARRTVIDASGIRGGGRVFEGIGAGALLVLERLAVTGGDVRTDGVAGIANEGGSVRSEGRLTLVEVAVRGNRAFVGGGVHVAGFFVMVRSTVGGNTTASDGGGLTLLGEASVVNSTMSGNEVTGLNNGAAVSLGSTGDLTAVNVTIADNRSADPERAAITGGGDAQAIFQNSVLANAPTADCHTFLDVESLGRNLSGDDTCRFSAAGDLTSIDAKLGPLRDNGGQTDTHALRRGSPAIDAAIAGAPDEDQRGITRPQGANADSGAFEKTRRRR